jgi:hypothetical protein
LGEGYRSLSSSLCSFLHFPVTPSLLGPNTLLNTIFSNTLTKFHTHTKQQAKLYFCIPFNLNFWIVNCTEG